MSTLLEVERIRLQVTNIGARRLYAFYSADSTLGSAFFDREAAKEWVFQQLEGKCQHAALVEKA